MEDTIVRRVRDGQERVQVYGEKNVTYAPFIPFLYEGLKCKFVLVVRDGRDVVTSLFNWHEKKFGTVYRECREAGDLSVDALVAAANLPVHLDTSDYSRPRPPRGTALALEWENLSRAEMCAYYWATINDLYLDELSRLPSDAWILIDYTAPTIEDVKRVADFCGLVGVECDRVQSMLERRINSLVDRGVVGDNLYPRWPNWDGGVRRRFDRLAASVMTGLAYYRDEVSRWRPFDYGRVWSERKADLGWYEWMFNGRRGMHEDLLAWISARDHEGDRIDSVMDFGCGLGVGYSELLANKRYIGVDLSAENISWCLSHRRNPDHRYVCIDFITDSVGETADLVFSSGTIDNAYDADAFLAAMVRHARKWIHVTCYRGWFPGLQEHRYSYNPEHACFYNDLSPNRLTDTLRDLQCTEITVRPVRTGNREIPFETLITARVPGCRPGATHVS